MIHNSVVSVLCSVIIAGWENLGVQGFGCPPRARVRAGPVSMSWRTIGMSYCYIGNSRVGVERSVVSADNRHGMKGMVATTVQHYQVFVHPTHNTFLLAFPASQNK